MTLEPLRVLVKVVDAGSVMAAAGVLGMQGGHVNRVIAQPETELIAAKRLIPVLLRWLPWAVEIFAVYPSNGYLTPKVRAFVDLAVATFPDPTHG